MQPTYENMKSLMENIHKDFEILAGNEVAPSSEGNTYWQDIAEDAALNLEVLAGLVRRTKVTGFVTFPCFSDIPRDSQRS